MTTWTEEKGSSIHKMLNPSSIAVVGANERMQYGGRFLRFAMEASPRVRVYPVNPRYKELMGAKCYPSLKELPESPDLVGVIVPYDRVLGVLEECVEKGAGSAIVISAGFAERREEGRRELQQHIGDLARQSGVRIAGPNCLGIANLKTNVWACSSSRAGGASAGPIALVSQSGASAFGPFLVRAADLGIGYSYIVSTGNEADLDAADFIRYLIDDDDTRVIACFIEGLKDGRKFIEVAKLAAARNKPIVVIKTGRSDVGTRAAMTHTAALTGSDAVHDAAFAQQGVVRVEDYDELLETSQLLASRRPMEKEGISLVSHSGGIASLSSDKCGQMGLELPPLTDAGRSVLDGVLKGFGGAENPADVTGYANSDDFPRIMEAMISEPEVGTLVVASAGADSQAEQVVHLRDSTHKSVVFLWTGSLSATDGLNKLKEARIPIFYQPGKLALGLRRRRDYERWRERHLGQREPQVKPVQTPGVEAVRRLRRSDRRSLTEHESKEFLSLYGIPITREKRVSSAAEAEAAARQIGYPVVLKVESSDILHKTDSGAVQLDIQNAQQLTTAYDEVLRNVRQSRPDARVSGMLVQEMISGSVEAIIGVSQDPTFGPVLLFGLGGVNVELYEDTVIRICPVGRADAEDMVAAVRASRLLSGYRGRPAADTDALIEGLLRVSALGVELRDEICQIDINPLAVMPAGQGIKALDALVVLR